MNVREKLIELLRCEHPIMCGDATVGVYQMPTEDAEGLATFLIANGVTVQEWIPVTERLPDKEFWEHQKRFEDEDLEVQVMIKGAKRPTTLLYNAEGEFYEIHDDGVTFYVVTHWAPLMEPPKEVE